MYFAPDFFLKKILLSLRCVTQAHGSVVSSTLCAYHNKNNKNTRSVKHTQEGFPDAPVRINPVKGHDSHQQLRHELREQLNDPSLPLALPPSVPPSLRTTKGDQRTINQHSPTLQFGWMVVGMGVFHWVPVPQLTILGYHSFLLPIWPHLAT
jgi:hypothetical protein